MVDDGAGVQITAGDQATIEGGLSEDDQAVLRFERQWFRHRGSKEAAILATFGLSATRYYQVLNALIDRPEAMLCEPLVVGRLRRLRMARQQALCPRRPVFGH
ncbi:MAG: DUF3263 domain-containing protein [Actinomycetes bacterium]